MKNAARARRIPSYVTTREDHVDMQAENDNRVVMGLMVASVVLAFISTILSVANLITKKD